MGVTAFPPAAIIGSTANKFLARGSADTELVYNSISTDALSFVAAADYSAMRSVLGLGTLATQSGTFSGTSSGTNTGDQTITLTGGVTGSGTGSFAATVITNANLTGPITSVGNATAIASQTGTGTTFVMSAAPTISGILTSSGAIQSSAETTNTPAGTTQTLTLNNGNHQTVSMASTTGNLTLTLTVPTTTQAGIIIIKNHGTTARSVTFAVSAGSITWLGTQPNSSTDAVNTYRLYAYRYNSTLARMFLSATDAG